MKGCENCRRDVSHLLTPGPGAKPRYCAQAENPECFRQRARLRSRKRHGNQWVVAKWDIYRDGELRTYSIVDLDLAREHHGRHKGRESEMLHEYRVRRLDKLATSWIKNGSTLSPEQPDIAEVDANVISIDEARDLTEPFVELEEAA